MERLGPFSASWGIRAWRISGDSEPLLNKDIDVLLRSGNDAGIDMGLITNGVYLDRVHELDRLRWLGVSLDAATRETWSRLKRSAPANYDRIISNLRRIRSDCPDLDISIKFLRWQATASLAKTEFGTYALPVLGESTALQQDNWRDAEMLPELARELGCRPIIKNAYPKNFASTYRFDVCRVTPLGGVFAADHSFHLCCDARSVFVLTDDYRRDDWQELPRLWGSAAHKDLIAKIDPQKCAGCAKHQMNELVENVALDSRRTPDYQVNFI
jgi:hypothetical protein